MFNLATYRNSLARSTKSTTLEVFFLCLLVGARFQVLFHSPPGVLFTFPSQYFFSIAHHVVFRLRGWSPFLPARFLVSHSTPDPTSLHSLSPTRLLRSLDSAFLLLIRLAYAFVFVVLTLNNRSYSVWPLPLSLATTYGISFDFSSWGYLDVSVHLVSPHNTMYSCYADLALN